MKTIKITFIFLLFRILCVGQGTDWNNFEKTLEIVNADYGICYTIGNYQLCPEKKLIKVGCKFGTATEDYFGYFPDSTLKYDEVTMIIFAGVAFFDKSDLNIDWQTVQLLSYSNSPLFTDGTFLYQITARGDIHKAYNKYDKNIHIFPRNDENPAKKSSDRKELTENFYVEGNTFYYQRTPILEPFDVPNLRTIVSKSGFETDFITDGKQVIFGGPKTGYSTAQKNGKEYVTTKRWIVEDIDLPSLRVLGKDLVADKNALYYGTNVIPFDKLNGLKFILREM